MSAQGPGQTTEAQKSYRSSCPDTTLSEIRIVIIGSRQLGGIEGSGKSSAGNIILGRNAFDVGRRTARSVEAAGDVHGRHLTVVDTPGWWFDSPLEKTSELDKLEIENSIHLCPPGPHVILLTVPIETTFNKSSQAAVEEHMSLLGKKVWNHTLVLFTRGDWLGDTAIEERIENEGKQLQWLIKKCGNRYHVFNCKQNTDSTQVLELLAKIEEMMMENNGCHYVPETDSNPSTELEIKMKIAKRKMRKVRRQRDILQELLKEQKYKLSDLRLVLLGGEGVGKSTSGNVILQANVFQNMQGENCKIKKKIKQCVMHQRKVEGWHVSVVDTPGWSSSTLENAKEIVQCVTVCSPGPHAFLLVLPAHQSYTQKAQKTVEQHMTLFGKCVWRHTLVLFTGGRWLRERPIEQYTACEEEALQELIERCGNRYYMLDEKGNKSQVKNLFKLIDEMVRRNRGECFTLEKKDIKASPAVLQVLNESETLRDEWNKREDELIEKMLKAAVVDLDAEESKQSSYRQRGSISQSTAPSEDSLSESSISIGAETLNPDVKVWSWLCHFPNNGASLDITPETSDMATLKYLSKIRDQKHARSLSF